MSTTKTIRKISLKDIPKLLVVLLAVTIICLLFPKHEKAAYLYSVGQSWAYEDLYANAYFETQIENTNPLDSVGDPITLTYQEGDVLIKKGAEVTPAKFKSLHTYFQQTNQTGFSTQRIVYFFGYFLLTALILGALFMFSIKYFPEITNSLRGVIFLVIWPVLFSAAVFLINLNPSLSPYMIPFCLVPIIVYNFYGERLALFIHIVVVLIASFLSGLGYEFTFLQILAGIVTLLVITETRYWNVFFKTILVILMTYIVGYLGLAMINSGSVNMSELRNFGWLGTNALLLLLAYPLSLIHI